MRKFSSEQWWSAFLSLVIIGLIIGLIWALVAPAAPEPSTAQRANHVCAYHQGVRSIDWRNSTIICLDGVAVQY